VAVGLGWIGFLSRLSPESVSRSDPAERFEIALSYCRLSVNCANWRGLCQSSVNCADRASFVPIERRLCRSGVVCADRASFVPIGRRLCRSGAVCADRASAVPIGFGVRNSRKVGIAVAAVGSARVRTKLPAAWRRSRRQSCRKIRWTRRFWRSVAHAKLKFLSAIARNSQPLRGTAPSREQRRRTQAQARRFAE
jgi:hypothetical protein